MSSTSVAARPQVMDPKAPYVMDHLLNPVHLGMPAHEQDFEPVTVNITRSDSAASHVPSEFWKMPRSRSSRGNSPTLHGRSTTKSNSNSSLFSKMKSAVKKRSAWHL